MSGMTINKEPPRTRDRRLSIELNSRVIPKVELKMSSYVTSIRDRFQEKFDEIGSGTECISQTTKDLIIDLNRRVIAKGRV